MKKSSHILLICLAVFVCFQLFGQDPIPTLKSAEESFKNIRAGDKDAIDALKKRIKDAAAQKKKFSHIDIGLLREVSDKADTWVFLKDLLNSLPEPEERSQKLPKNVVSKRSFTDYLAASDLRGNILAEMIVNFYKNPKPENRTIIENELKKLQYSDIGDQSADRLLISLFSSPETKFPDLWKAGREFAAERLKITKDPGMSLLINDLLYQYKVISGNDYAKLLKEEYLKNKDKVSEGFYFDLLKDRIISNKELFDKEFVSEVSK